MRFFLATSSAAAAALVAMSASAATISIDAASIRTALDLPDGVSADSALTPFQTAEEPNPSAVFALDVLGDAFDAMAVSSLEVTMGTATFSGGFTARIDLRNDTAASAEVLVSNDFGFSASAFAGDSPASVPASRRSLAEISLAFVPFVGSEEARFVFDLGLEGETDDLATTFFTDSFSQSVLVPAGGTRTLEALFSFRSTATEISPVPVPAAAWLLLAGLGGLAALRRGT